MSEAFRVLIATEHPVEGLEIAAALAKRWGRIDAIFAQDGAEAYGRLGERAPHLVIASAGLPQINGLALVAQLRRSSQLGGLATVVLLDGGAIHLIREALAARPSAIVVRPFTRKKLLEQIILALATPVPPLAHTLANADSQG